MPSRDITDLDPSLQPIAEEFLARCKSVGLSVFLTCTYRSNDEQNADYAKGRTLPGAIITNAQAGQSPHNCTDANGTPAARAFDFAISNPDGSLDWNPKDAHWQIVLNIGKSLGLISGGSWRSIKDWPHFELANWRTNPTPLENT